MTNLTIQMTNKIQRFVANETTVFAEIAPSMSKNTEINSQLVYNKLFSTSRLFTKGTSIMTEQITKHLVSYDLLKLVDGSIEYPEIAVLKYMVLLVEGKIQPMETITNEINRIFENEFGKTSNSPMSVINKWTKKTNYTQGFKPIENTGLNHSKNRIGLAKGLRSLYEKFAY